MCLGGSSGGGSSGPQMVDLVDTEGQHYRVEAGVPIEYARRGITTTTQYQQTAQEDLSNRQMAAQKEISDQQLAFNQSQFDYQKALDDRQRTEATDQATRQTAYDTGRAQLLDEGAGKINEAFARFTPEFFGNYANDYMAKVGDQVGYQKQLAVKDTAFDAARRGIFGGQGQINKLGLIQEQEGRTLAEQSENALNAANALKGTVASTKQNLLGQVQTAESLGSPIAGGDLGSVNSAINTQRQAISGITNQAGDVTASLNPVPTVSTLGSIFGNLLSAGGSYLSGRNAGAASAYYGQQASGMNPTPFR